MPVLVIKHGALGDFFQSLPLFQAIRQHHRHDSVTLLTTAPFKNFAHELGLFDRVLTDCRQGVPWDFLREGRKEAYTCLYDLQLSKRTGWYLRFLRCLLPLQTRFYGKRQAPPKTTHSFARRKALLIKAGFSAKSIEDSFSLESFDPPFPNLLSKPYALVVAGASTSSRIWPIAQFINVGQWCQTQGITPVLVGGDAEKVSAQTFCKEVSSAIDATGETTPMDILKLGTQARIAVGNDTGPMHGIAMVGCPSVVLFSRHAAPPAISAPIGRVRVIQEELARLSAQRVIDELRCLIVHPL
jgi:ADP-heptose:LPS heptosyltransferase